MPARPWSIPPARSTHSTPLPKSTPIPEQKSRPAIFVWHFPRSLIPSGGLLNGPRGRNVVSASANDSDGNQRLRNELQVRTTPDEQRYLVHSRTGWPLNSFALTIGGSTKRLTWCSSITNI